MIRCLSRVRDLCSPANCLTNYGFSRIGAPGGLTALGCIPGFVYPAKEMLGHAIRIGWFFPARVALLSFYSGSECCPGLARRSGVAAPLLTSLRVPGDRVFDFVGRNADSASKYDWLPA